jgi:hypothetical protein
LMSEQILDGKKFKFSYFRILLWPSKLWV